MKKIVFLCIIILIAVYIFYPVFDSEGISYLIIFGCFATLCFTIAKIMTGNFPTDYESTEKEMNRRYSEDGIFSYNAEGFYFKKESKPQQYIKYSDIIEVNSFSIRFMQDQTQSGLEIITVNEKYEFLDQYCTGMEKFTEKLSENLPFHQNDELKMMNNNGLKKRNLYLRSYENRFTELHNS
ncbi:hypothetical protein [Chryseobacterium sp. VD8]|uniref:hypothetical protein n=1 Tax=Chryseobacterium sp. VD8 TaxID=3081254 RepID=UPI003017A7CB